MNFLTKFDLVSIFYACHTYDMDKKIVVKDISVNIATHEREDYISLTDIARYKNHKEPADVIKNWVRTTSTLDFLGVWEKINNQSFKVVEFHLFKTTAINNGLVVSIDQWITKTSAIGIFARRGRYGGTYAHKDIAFEFASWISPEFKLYLIKEFQRLKLEENDRLTLGWDLKRELAKVNYKIHTDAIKENLIPPLLPGESKNIIYANEADVLNVALFGLTAQEWRNQNHNKEGNIRDRSTLEQLVILSNLESLNAELIRQNVSQGERLKKLNEIAIYQMKSLLTSAAVKKLK